MQWTTIYLLSSAPERTGRKGVEGGSTEGTAETFGQYFTVLEMKHLIFKFLSHFHHTMFSKII